MTRRLIAILALALAAAGLGLVSGAHAAPTPRVAPVTVEVGVGQADITPYTGGFKGGWACSCAKALGQQTRLYAHAVVLQRGTQKVALVSADLSFFGNGMLRDAAKLLANRGFTDRNIIVSATHTHGSQMGFMNYGAYNTVLPSVDNLADLALPSTPADQLMYNLMTRQLATAIRRADDDRRPGSIGWGHTTLYGVTHNRSLEAHLADYGIIEAPGTGNVSQDPHGYDGTVDPAVDVLRVDQRRGGRSVPVGVFTTFANHGTIVQPDFDYFSADHQGAAERILSARIRRAGHAPASQTVVTAFANSDAGDMSSGLVHRGPAYADVIGAAEARAMFRAWRAAGRSMTTMPKLAVRWTRVCMCGQTVDGHPTDKSPILGLGQAAGSEEGRTILFQLGLAHEGDHLPLSTGVQGDKVQLLNESGEIPGALPLSVLQVDDRMLVTWPGEATIGVGAMVRQAVLPIARSAGMKDVVFVGYANEYSDYWTTPAEYAQQHYEGGSTVFGQYSSLVLRDGLVGLARSLVARRPAPAAYASDPNQGLHLTTAAYAAGAAAGVPTSQPATTARLGHPAFAWTGGGDGADRPVDRAFVTVQRWTSGHWTGVADDLGLQMLWGVDSKGAYTAQWEVPASARTGRYRFLVTAKRYRLASHPFTVTTGAILTPVTTGGVVRLALPAAGERADWTPRAAFAGGGRIRFLVDGRSVVVSSATTGFAVPAGTHVSIPAGAARDRYGNTNAAAVTIR
ncbi:MAG TPA: neutral/alkaline non-lysosomal ceramidase N-terminal domain-containing protein [Nocardioides sp.]|nr:neutral/alkaline non-lysosomal ceramidase N-terminal domain-containing protein [Nocardioides sp.]